MLNSFDEPCPGEARVPTNDHAIAKPADCNGLLPSAVADDASERLSQKLSTASSVPRGNPG